MGLLNWNKEFALEQAAEDAELLQELLEIFKDSFKADILLIREGIASDDYKKIAGAAHSIKGAAASLGIEGVTEVVKDIEIDSQSGSVEIAKAKVSVLELMMQELNEL